MSKFLCPRLNDTRHVLWGTAVCLVGLLCLAAPAASAAQPLGLGDSPTYGLGDRPPTPEEEAYVNANVVEVDEVRPNALAIARAMAERAAAGGSGAPSDGLPLSVDNSTLIYFPPIRSQGSQGSCTAWAAGYYYNTFTQARDAGVDVSGGDNNNICSPAFLYPIVNDGVDLGAYTSYVVALLDDIGCASWATMPYDQGDWTTWPTEAAWLEALTWRTNASYSINGSSQAGLTAIKQHLANGNVAVTRFPVYWTWYTQYPSNATGINNRVYYAQAGAYAGGHAVTIVGYNDNRSYVDHRDGQTHYGAFLIANSWGSSWGWYNSTESGSQGFFWVAYTMFLESTFGPYAYFNSDRADYEPKLYAAAGINHSQRGRVALRGGVGATGSPEFNGPYAIYYEGGNSLAIADSKRVVVDLTDGTSLFEEGEPKQVFVRLTVSSGASSNGTITSVDFTHDLDDDGSYETVASTDPVVTVTPGTSGYATADVCLGPPCIYVDASNTSGPWNGTWSYPYRTIQDGIDAAQDDEVVVADGTYTGASNKDLDFGAKAITVRSENGPDACIIDCEGAGCGFYFDSGETAASIVDGFTIRNGNPGGGGGGGVYCANSSPTIMNCRITANEATLAGGGIFFSGSDATVLNCTITGNEAVNAYGGSLFISDSSNVTIINCTITGNVADDGGAAYCLDSNPTLTNCILWSNGPNEIVLAGTAAPTLNYCDIEGGWAGAGSNNIDQDPLFYDAGQWDGGTWVEGNYRLMPGSPCIDSGFGDNGSTVPDTDIGGCARLDDLDMTNTGGGTPDYVDMGAHERQGTWTIRGTGDFNGDGKADIVWYNSSTGYVGIWLMNGWLVKGAGIPATVDPTQGWAIKGVGDFNGDGKADILWRDATAGYVGIWLMSGLRLSAAGISATVDPASGWAIKGVGDFNGNGKADILWRDATMGEVAVWLMNGVSVGASGIPATVDPASGWAIKGAGDFNGDAKADILWRDATTGQVGIWLMNGVSCWGGGIPGTVFP